MLSWASTTITHTVAHVGAPPHPFFDWCAMLIPGFMTGGAVVASAIISARAVRVATVIAGRQAKTEADRLRVELFDRRFQLWIELRDAINEYRDAIRNWSAGGMTEALETTDLARVHAAQHQVQFLFGKEAHAAINVVKATTSAAVSARIAVQNGPPGQARIAATERWLGASQTELAALDGLVLTLERHLSLADVGRRE